jgi:hypothetical protein
MAIHVRRIRLMLVAGAILFGLTSRPTPVRAQSTANFYSTAAASGTENYAAIRNAGGTGVPEPVRLISACNYNSGAPEVVMVFDAGALPANGSLPKMMLPLPASSGSNAPSCASFSMPAGGVTFYAGVVVAASTTGRTLTVDTTSGGNSYFEVAH